MNEEEIIRQAMSLMGSRKSERKRAAGRINIAYAATHRKLKPCSCSQVPHKPGCPVYAREAQRKHRKKKL